MHVPFSALTSGLRRFSDLCSSSKEMHLTISFPSENEVHQRFFPFPSPSSSEMRTRADCGRLQCNNGRAVLAAETEIRGTSRIGDEGHTLLSGR